MSATASAAALSRLRQLRRVLVVSKRTRWEFASTRFGGIGGKELEQLLRARGFPYERIAHAHHAHHDALDNVVRALTRRGIDVRLVRAPALIASDLESVDCVFTAGGDGTVLETAARIKSNEIPVLSINTDPSLSHGHLCAFRLNSGQSFDKGVLDKLKRGLFSPNPRSRIQVHYKSRDEYSPLLALNEVFYAERDASRPTVHETRLPSVCPAGLVQRSSGVIVATGTGSTAWMSSANMVHRSDIARVLRAAISIKEAMGESPCHWSDDEIDQLTREVSTESIFEPTSKQIQYCMRELVLNGWQGEHDTPLSKHPKHGFDSSITIRSLAWDGVLTFDGIESQGVPYGETLHISIAPENKSLLTVSLDQSP